MATWVNREAWWAVDHKKVLHVVRVLQQDLAAKTMEVLLDNGARHTAPADEMHLTKDAAELAVAFAYDAATGYGRGKPSTRG